MGDLRELYQEVILDHSRRPRNFCALECPDRQAAGHNPLCGDRVIVYLRLRNDRLEQVSFEGAGCAISTASASLMTEMLKGRTIPEALEMFDQVHHMLTGTGGNGGDLELGKLAVLAGVREFPTRVKCATLAWHTARAALMQSQAPVTTDAPPVSGVGSRADVGDGSRRQS